MERREADSEDHQDGGQQSDGTRPPSPALLRHQALAGGQKTGDAQGEAHHGQQGEQELQDGEVEEGREEHTGGAEPQRCGLWRARERPQRDRLFQITQMTVKQHACFLGGFSHQSKLNSDPDMLASTGSAGLFHAVALDWAYNVGALQKPE